MDNETRSPPWALPSEERERRRAADRALFDAFYAQLERPPTSPKGRTAGQDRRYQQRANLRRRLRELGKALADATDWLERVHSDRSGAHHYAPLPLLESQWRGSERAPGLAARFERVRRDAAEGCELSAQFVRDQEPLFLLCEHLRQQRPPARARDWDPLEALTPAQRRWLADGSLPELDDGQFD